MKPILFMLLTLLGLLIIGCDSKVKKSSSSSTDCSGNNYYTVYGCGGYNTYSTCTGNNYYTVPGCPGYTGSTTGSTTGGTVTCVNQYYLSQCNSGYQYYYSMCASNSTLSYCSGFCTFYPTASSCTGSTTGSDNGDTYGDLYPQGVPAGSCSAATGPGFDTRLATMTIVGGSWMNPASAEAPYYLTTSYDLKSTAAASNFISAGSDALVKVRFKVQPEPVTAQTTGVCYGRTTGASIPGYTQLKFTVSVASKDSPSSLQYVGEYTVGVNSCTSAINLSSWKQVYPNGFFVVVSNVLSNQECSNYNYTTGFQNCTVFGPVRTKECWKMDVEVAVDGSKTF